MPSLNVLSIQCPVLHSTEPQLSFNSSQTKPWGLTAPLQRFTLTNSHCDDLDTDLVYLQRVLAWECLVPTSKPQKVLAWAKWDKFGWGLQASGIKGMSSHRNLHKTNKQVRSFFRLFPFIPHYSASLADISKIPAMPKKVDWDKENR